MSERPRGRPRTEPFDVQRRRVLDAARAAFVERGYDDATVAAIAADAVVSRAVVYETVGDKAALIAAVVAEVATEFEDAMEARLVAATDSPGNLPELIDDQVRWFLQALVADREMRVLLSVSSRLEATSPAVAAVRRRVEDVLTDVYVAVAASFGVERTAGARVVAAMVLAMVESLAVRPEVDDEWPLDELAAIVGAFVAGAIERVERPGGALDALDAVASASAR